MKEMSKAPLNVIWISLEDTSPRFGCYGDTVARTPNIDRLAAEGTRFPNAFSPAPVCSPSRLAVITGRYATEQGGHHMRTTAYANYDASVEAAGRTPYCAVPYAHVKCLTETLRSAGYFCTNNGKTDYNMPTPFAAWDRNRNNGPWEETHWRARPDPEQPFFAVFNLESSHESCMWPEKALPAQTHPADVEVPPFLVDTPETRAAIARQYDNIAYNDEFVGRILSELEEDGLAKNTVVFLWSDHGEGLPRAKRFLYDSGTRVPMIVRWPGKVLEGVTNERLVSLLDLPATTMSLLGFPLPADYSGAPFIGPAERPREACFSHADRFDADYLKNRSVRTERYRYIRNYYDGRERYGHMDYRGRHDAMRAIRAAQIRGETTPAIDTPFPPEELFDVVEDPHQMNNLAAVPAMQDVLLELRERLEQWQLRHDPYLNTPEAEIAQRFWPGGVQPDTLTPQVVLYDLDCLEGRVVDQDINGPGPVLLQLHCLTEGATVAYRFHPEAPWTIYREALRLEAGDRSIELCAERYGFKTSPVRTLKIQLSAS